MYIPCPFSSFRDDHRV